MNIVQTNDGTTTTLALDGWLDTSTAPELANAMNDITDDCTMLIIDLAKLEYISSAGLRQLVAGHKKMRGSFKIVNVSVEIMQVFKMAGFDKRLDIS